MTTSNLAVETESGIVVGTSSQGLNRWRSIPYAAPPVGELRWRAPQPHPGWTEPRDATAFGPRSMQPAAPMWSGQVPVDAPVRFSEDSLTLNIIAPDGEPPAGGWPVLFYVHGGALIAGSPVELGEGDALAAAGMVMVSVQYRLGPFGYLDLSCLDPAERDSGVAGLLDQIAALTWTRRNVAAFGGNPDSITAIGGSAGAKSVAFLLASPLAKGTIARAVICSGTANLVATPETAAERTQLFLEALSGINGQPVSGLADLRSAPAEQLLEASDRLLPPSENTWLWRPTLHPEVLPELPIDAIAHGAAEGVDLLLGTCLREGEFFVNSGRNLPEVIAEVERNIDLITGAPTSEAVLAMYESSRGMGRADAAVAIYGDAQYGIPTIRLADAQSPHGNVWRYRLDVSIPGLTSLGIPAGGHGADSPILWGVRIPPDIPGVVFEDDADAIGDACDLFTAAVMSFVTTGTPSMSRLHWTTYDPVHRPTLIFDAHPRLENDPRADERAIWGDRNWIASTWFPIRRAVPMKATDQ